MILIPGTTKLKKIMGVASYTGALELAQDLGWGLRQQGGASGHWGRGRATWAGLGSLLFGFMRGWLYVLPFYPRVTH